MDTIALEVGTVALFHRQGRVVVAVTDMANTDLAQPVRVNFLGAEHNLLEGVGRDKLVLDSEVEQELEGDAESLLAGIAIGLAWLAL